MWTYEKRLQYPIKIKNPDPAMAKIIITQFGGPDGELAASMRYLSQRYTMPYREVSGLLTDIGSEVIKCPYSSNTLITHNFTIFIEKINNYIKIHTIHTFYS